MPESPKTIFSSNWNDASEVDMSYGQWCVMAIVAFVFGAASFLVFFSIWFCFLSLIGALLGLGAAYRIRQSEGALTGRAFAQIGLALSIISLLAVAVLWPSYHYALRRESDQFFRLWFHLATDSERPEINRIPALKGFSAYYWGRPSTEDIEKWWKDLYENKFAHRDIHQYLENKLLRTMLALGNKAKVSRYKTLDVATTSDKDTVVSIYAVTYPTATGKSETFFVKMVGERSFPTGDHKSAGWRLASVPEFIVPDELKNDTQSPTTVQEHSHGE